MQYKRKKESESDLILVTFENENCIDSRGFGEGCSAPNTIKKPSSSTDRPPWRRSSNNSTSSTVCWTLPELSWSDVTKPFALYQTIGPFQCRQISEKSFAHSSHINKYSEYIFWACVSLWHHAAGIRIPGAWFYRNPDCCQQLSVLCLWPLICCSNDILKDEFLCTFWYLMSIVFKLFNENKSEILFQWVSKCIKTA